MLRGALLIPVLAALALLAPASAAGAPRLAGERPLASSNVTPLATLPVPNPIGARFRDGFMYVTTTEGLTVYDVTKPELPVPVSALRRASSACPSRRRPASATPPRASTTAASPT